MHDWGFRGWQNQPGETLCAFGFFRPLSGNRAGQLSARDQPLADGGRLKLLLWEITGNDAPTSVEDKFMWSAAASPLVADGTRRPAFDDRARGLVGSLLRVLAINKRDPAGDWAIGDTDRGPEFARQAAAALLRTRR